MFTVRGAPGSDFDAHRNVKPAISRIGSDLGQGHQAGGSGADGGNLIPEAGQGLLKDRTAETELDDMDAITQEDRMGGLESGGGGNPLTEHGRNAVFISGKSGAPFVSRRDWRAP